MRCDLQDSSFCKKIACMSLVIFMMMSAHILVCICVAAQIEFAGLEFHTSIPPCLSVVLPPFLAWARQLKTTTKIDRCPQVCPNHCSDIKL